MIVPTPRVMDPQNGPPEKNRLTSWGRSGSWGDQDCPTYPVVAPLSHLPVVCHCVKRVLLIYRYIKSATLNHVFRNEYTGIVCH
jgi:hypothetical protein